MANKEKMKLPKNGGLDSELDFDFDFDDIGIEAEKNVKKEKRKPVNEAIKGTIKGAKSAALNRNTINKLVENALPKEYGEIINRTKETKDTVAGLYNDAVKDIKPNVDRIVKEVDKLVPQEMKRSKSFLNRIKKVLNIEESEKNFSSSDDSREAGLQSTLADVFKLQAEQQVKESAENRAENLINKQTEQARFQSSFGILNSINGNVARLSAYNEKVNSSFQKKSLELQYRSYFAQKDLLETTRSFFQVFKAQNEAIAKNTSLPDFVKITKSEIFKEVALKKFAGKAGSLFSSSQFFKQGVTNLKNAGKQKISDLQSTLSSVGDMLESASQAKEMSDSMSELGGESSSAIEMISELVASFGVEEAAKRLGKQLGKKVPPSVLSKIMLVHKLTYNAKRGFKQLRKSKMLEQNLEDDLTKTGKFKNKFKSALGDLMDIFYNSGADLKLASTGIGDLGNASLFDKKTQRSITDIIPGYLSRIYREIQVLRTGNENIELTTFDHRSGRFTSKGKMTKSIKNELSNKIQTSAFKSEINSTIDLIKGDTKLSKEAENALKEKMHDIAFSSDVSDMSTLMNPSFLKGLNPKVAKELSELFKKRFSGDKETLTTLDAKLSRKFDDIQDSVGDVRGDIEALFNAGYGDILKQLKIVEYKNGEFSINLEGYKKLIKNDGLAKAINKKYSDNQKSDFSIPKQEPKTFKQTSNSNTGTTGEFNKQKSSFSSLGGGSSTINVNPIPNGESDKESVSILSSIKTDTVKMVDLLEKLVMNGITTSTGDTRHYENFKDFLNKGKNNFYKWRNKNNSKQETPNGKKPWSERFSEFSDGNFKTIPGLIKNVSIGAGTLLLKSLETIGGKLGKAKKDYVEPGIENAKDFYNKNKDPAIAQAKNLLGKGVELVGTVFEKTSAGVKDFLQNKLPVGVAQAKAVLNWTKENVKMILDAPVDIYVPGNPTPLLRASLMRAGAYFDQKTGNPIKIPSQINGPVVNQDGEVVLTFEDIGKGLVDSNGKPITSIKKKLLNLALGAAGYVGGKLKDGFENLMSLGGSIKDRIKQGFPGFPGFGIGSKKVYNVLIQIRDLLNNRLRGKKQTFSETTVDIGKPKANKPTDVTEGEQENKPGILSGLINKVKSKFTKKDTENKEGEAQPKKSLFDSMFGKLNSIKDNLTDKFKKDKQPEEQKTEKPKRENDSESRYEKSKQFTKDRIANTKAAVADATARYKGANVLDIIADKAGKAFDAIKNGLSGIADIAGLGGKGKKAGMMGRLASGAWSAAKSVGRFALGSGGTLLRAGALMTGGLTSLTLSAGSALVGVLTSPALLPIAASALIGYGVYKGFKFLKRNQATLLTRVRLAQYGFGDSLSNEFHRLFELEQYLESNCLVFQGKQAQLSPKNMKAEDVLGIFGIETSDDEAVAKFTSWFSGRFKPVFLTHQTALLAANGKKSLSEIDKLKSSEKEVYLKAASNIPNIYQVTVSPLKDGDPLEVTSKDVDDLAKEARDEWKDDLDENGKEKVGLIAGAAKATWNFFTKNDTLDKAAKKGGILGAMASIAKYVPGLALAANILEPVAKFTTKALSKIGQFAKDVFSRGWSAIEAVRFRVYGLNAPTKFKTASLRKFEAYMAPLVSIRNGEAYFEGDINKILAEAGEYFGIGSVTDPNAPEWIKWFNKRFLPIFLKYMGYASNKSRKPDLSLIESTFSASESFELAASLAAIPGVWSVNANPWGDGEALCDSVSDCKENLDYLKDAAKKETVQNNLKKTINDKPEESAKAPVEKQEAKVPKELQQKATEVLGGIGEEPKQPATGPVDKSSTIQASKVNKALGPLANPDDGGQYLNLLKNAKLDGVNPELLKNLKMMAAEYGQMTGKSIPVTSGSRSREEQAELYKNFPGKAAAPGSSLHEFGLAIDIDSKTANELDKLGLMRKYGFTRPVGQETWHMEPAGIQTNISMAKEDVGFANQAILNSLGKGGGGYGALSDSSKGRRNPKYALSLLEDSASATVAAASNKQTSKAILADKTPTNDNVPKPTEADSAKSILAQSTKPSTESATAKPEMTIAANSSTNNTIAKSIDFKESEPSSIGKIADQADAMEKGGQDSIKNIVIDAAKKVGIDPNMAQAVVAIESRFNPDAKSNSSSATGLYQFTNKTWAEMLQKYGSKYNLSQDVKATDPKANALLGAEYLKQNLKSISSIKSNPSATDLYLAHFLGASGARQLLSADPSQIAANLFPKAARDNPTIFYENNQPRTVGQIYEAVKNKLYTAARQNGIALADTPSQPPRTSGNIQIASTAQQPINSPIQPGNQPPRTTGNSAIPQGNQPARTDAPGVNLPPSQPPRTTSSPLGLPSTSLPGVINTNRIPPIEQGKSFDLSGMTGSMTNIDKTLSKSLTIQEQMLETLKQVVSNIDPARLSEIAKSLSQVTNTVSQKTDVKGAATPIPPSAVSLNRA